MAKRRSRGDGGLHWDEDRQRWIATASLGFDGRGKRITKTRSGKTKTEAKNKLKELLRDHESGLPVTDDKYTVGDAVESWMVYGLRGCSKATVDNYRHLVDNHIAPFLGKRSLRWLTADEVDEWLEDRAPGPSTRSLRLLHSILNRSVTPAQARDKVFRNVVSLCQIPEGGKAGRPSKALTLEQAEAVLDASENSPLHAYIVLSLLIGARPEELRASPGIT